MFYVLCYMNLYSDHLDHQIAFARTVKIHRENILLVGNDHLPLLNRQSLTHSQKQRLTMGVAIAPAVRFSALLDFKQIMGILVVRGNHFMERTDKVLNEHRLVVIDRHAHRGMGGINKHLPFPNSGFIHDRLNLIGNIEKISLLVGVEIDVFFENLHKSYKITNRIRIYKYCIAICSFLFLLFVKNFRDYFNHFGIKRSWNYFSTDWFFYQSGDGFGRLQFVLVSNQARPGIQSAPENSRES